MLYKGSVLPAHDAYGHQRCCTSNPQPPPGTTHNIQNRDILHQVYSCHKNIKICSTFIPYIFNEAISNKNKIQPKGISFPTSTLKEYQ